MFRNLLGYIRIDAVELPARYTYVDQIVKRPIHMIDI